MAELCLTLLCPPQAEEELLDLLLLSPHVGMFTSGAVAAHGMEFGELSQTEQVLGQAEAVRVEVLCTHAGKAALLDEIGRCFAGSAIRYWATPLADMGVLA